MKWILPVIFIVYSFNISLFTHVHIENGVTIVHSHPYNDSSEGQGHKHASLSEIQLFHALSHYNIADGAIQTVELPSNFSVTYQIIEPLVTAAYSSLLKGVILLRAPPFVS